MDTFEHFIKILEERYCKSTMEFEPLSVGAIIVLAKEAKKRADREKANPEGFILVEEGIIYPKN